MTPLLALAPALAVLFLASRPAPAGVGVAWGGKTLGAEALEGVRAARRGAPTPPGAIVKVGPGHMYVGREDTAHHTYLQGRLRELAAAEADPQRKRGALAFLALQGREGPTTSINTYDNQIVSWGTGYGGLGLLGQVFDRLDSAARAKLDRAGLRYLGSGVYSVVDESNGHVVTGKKEALEVVRKSLGLLRVLIDVARAKDTRDSATKAQLDTFLAWSGKIESADQIATQALYNLVSHLQHWAPGYARGAITAAARQIPGAPSVARDQQLADAVARSFYAKAAGSSWIPSWKQFKGYLDDFAKDGGTPPLALLGSPSPPSASPDVGAFFESDRKEAEKERIDNVVEALHHDIIRANPSAARRAAEVLQEAKIAEGGAISRLADQLLGKGPPVPSAVTEAFVEEWIKWRLAWRHFHDEVLIRAGYWGDGADGALLDYWGALKTLYDRFVAFGGKPSQAMPAAPTGPSGSTRENLILGGLLIAGIAGLYAISPYGPYSMGYGVMKRSK